jgi:Nitrite and sulphite reductase 4Fe-4S domain
MPLAKWYDLGYIAILDKKGTITGYNVTVGGGMGMTHGEPPLFRQIWAGDRAGHDGDGTAFMFREKASRSAGTKAH